MVGLGGVAARLVELGDSGNLEEVARVVEGVEGEGGLEELVSSLCTSTEGQGALHHLLRSLCRRPAHAAAMAAVARQVWRNTIVPHRLAATQLELLYTEVEEAGAAELVELVGLCLAELRGPGSATAHRGLPLLPRLLAAVERRGAVTPEPEVGVVVAATVYRSQVVEEVCAMAWDQDRVAALGAMFQEVRLGEADLARVVAKLLACLEEVAVQAVPPLVHHLLLLCRSSQRTAALVLRHITQYFASRLPAGRATDFASDVPEERGVEELRAAEGTVVYHVSQQARAGHPIAREVVRVARAAAQAPEALDPCSLLLALALAADRRLQAPLLDSLRQAVTRALALEERRRESAWVREVVPGVTDLPSLLGQVIEESRRSGGWDLVGQGVVDLGLALLDQQPGLGRCTPRLAAAHRLGASLLLQVVRLHRETARLVVEPLTARILQSTAAPQYTEALR